MFFCFFREKEKRKRGKKCERVVGRRKKSLSFLSLPSPPLRPPPPSLSLSLTARLEQARHDHRVGSPVELVRQVLAVQEHDPRAPARGPKLVGLVERLELAVGVARAEQHELAPEVPAGVDQRPLYQVQPLVGHEARHADHERGRRVDGEPQAALDKLLADPLALPKGPRVVVGGQARVRGRVPEVHVEAVQQASELGGDVRPRQGSAEPPRGAAIEGLGAVGRGHGRDGV